MEGFASALECYEGLKNLTVCADMGGNFMWRPSGTCMCAANSNPSFYVGGATNWNTYKYDPPASYKPCLAWDFNSTNYGCSVYFDVAATG